MIAEEPSLDILDTPMSCEAAVAVLEELAAGVSPDVQALVDAVPQAGEDRTDAILLEPVPVPDVTQHWSKSAFHSVIESLPDAIVVIDGDGYIRLVNEQTEEMFGYRRRDEMYGWPIELLVPTRFRAGHVAQRDSYLANPRIRPMGESLELFGRRKNGSEFPVEISLSPIETDDGTLVASTIRDTTQKKQAEAKLQSAEARYRTLVEEIPAVTFMAALDGGAQELYVSPQIEKLLGFSQKEWLENPILWYRQLHPDDRERWHTEFARTCSAGEHFLSEYRFIARDGKVVWVHGEAKMVRDAHGRPLFLQGVAFDITDRKKAEETLKTANDELERQVRDRTAELRTSLQEKNVLLNDSLDAVVTMNAEGAIIDWNPQAEKTFGWSRDEAIGRKVAELIIPLHLRAAHLRGLANFLTTGRGRILNQRSEFTALRHDGSIFPVELGVTPVRSRDSYVFSAFIRDITERKQAQERIEADERKYRRLVETTQTGYLIVDEQGRVIDSNTEYARLSGHKTLSDIRGRSVLEWTAEHDRERSLKEIRQCVEKGYIRDLELDYEDGAGVLTPVEVNARIWQTDEGLRILSLCRDITERRQAGEALAQQAAELQRSNADLDELAYVAAHDLKAPARTVNLIAQTLQKRYRDQLSEEAMASISGIITNARWMYRMVEDLYKNSQVGRDTALEPVDCNALLDLVRQNLQSMIEESNAHVVRDDLPMVVANRTDLSQVFQNLIQNAIKFRSEERLPEIRISAERENEFWHFRVKDNGIGIDPQFHSKIFQLSERLSRETEGSGIGLNTCKKAIERRGGRIRVESQPGEGSIFFFTLPAVEEPPCV